MGKSAEKRVETVKKVMAATSIIYRASVISWWLSAAPTFPGKVGSHQADGGDGWMLAMDVMGGC